MTLSSHLVFVPSGFTPCGSAPRDGAPRADAFGLVVGLVVGLVAAGAPGCGGGQTPAGDPAGQTSAVAGEGLGAGDPVVAPDGEASPSSPQGDGATDPGQGAAAAPAERPPVTFRISNTAEDDLVLNMDKGWQPVISAYSGKPPNAVPILLFPTHCTAACDADAADRCPFCPEPERVRDIKAAEKREVIVAGASLEVPWDGQVFVYEKAKGTREGRNVKCDCFRKEPVPAASYTVRACGLRITTSASAASKYQCVTAEIELPADEPQVVELAFPTP